MIIDITYCTSADEGLMCRNIVRCWSGRMDIVHYLKKTMGEEGFGKKFGDIPKTRLERIVELVNNSVEKYAIKKVDQEE